jgi:hypothetical protein
MTSTIVTTIAFSNKTKKKKIKIKQNMRKDALSREMLRKLNWKKVVSDE